ncbi:MAG: GHKL domain-containing protein [Lachnospiraceae bacterium]|nr:GHKL domain-containing protein [Lachnospiraceae bacterium]
MKGLFDLFRGERKDEDALEKERQRLLEQDYKRIVALSREKSRLLHDIKNHLLIIEGLLKYGLSEKALVYIQELRNSELESKPWMQSDNVIVNALMNEKINLAKSKGIKVQLKTSDLKDSFINDRDWCVILGNLLDNAIEACEKVEGKKDIIVKIDDVAYGTIINIRNSYCGEIPDMEGEVPTAKDDKEEHGIGNQNVRLAAKKYGAIILYKKEKEMFGVTLVLYR